MPRAHWGRFEPPDHFVLGHLCDPLAFSARGSPQAAKRFIACVLFMTLGETDLAKFASLFRWHTAAACRTRSAISVSRTVHRPTPKSFSLRSTWRGSGSERRSGF